MQKGDKIPQLSDEWQLWNRQYRNVTKDEQPRPSPNYSRQLGALCAGMLQQQPVEIADTEDAAAPLTKAQLADLTDRGVKRAAAEGVVFMRPALVAGDWVVGILHAGQVHAKWMHDTLVSAVVWWIADDEDTLMVLERYDFTTDAPPAVELWRVKETHGTGQYQLVEKINIDAPDDGAEGEALVEPELHAQLREMQPRSLVPFVWDFEGGMPVPIHVTNEYLVEQLTVLHVGEDDDDTLPSNIIATSADTLNESERAYDGDKKFGRLRGFRPGKNMLAVPADKMAQNSSDAFVKQIKVTKDLVMRDKIDRKTNELFEACGIAPQSFGRHVGGRSDSGDAKRADNQTTLVTIAGPARRWAAALSAVVNDVAALEGSNGNSGTEYRVAVTEGLKMSAEERAELVRTQRDADASSIQTGVASVHPDWSDEEVQDEVARIRIDNQIPTAPEF